MNRSIDPSGWYRNHGDERPQYGALEKRLGLIYGNVRSNILITAADMCIDLAMLRPEKSEEYIAISKGHLDTVIKRATLAKKESHEDLNAQSIRATEAAFKRKDLPLWQQAARQDKIDFSFIELFKAFSFTEMFNASDQAQNLRLEAVPLLLGFRGLRYGLKFGFGGRMALLREEKRINSDYGNANWDCGIFWDLPIDSIEVPQRKIQMKKKGKSGGTSSASNHAKAGVLSISATQFNLVNTTLVKVVCLEELKKEGLEIPPRVPGSSRLDEITGELLALCKRPVELK